MNALADRLARHPRLVGRAFGLDAPADVDLDPVTWGLRGVLSPWLPDAARVAEVGTGPGALLATWVHRRTGRPVVAVEWDPDRAARARARAPAGVEVRVGDGPAAVGGPVDLLVFNPPYLPRGAALAGLPAHVWDGGPEGTAVLARWLGAAAALPARRVVFGVGARWVRGAAAEAVIGPAWRVRRRYRTPGARLWVLELTTPR